MGPVVISMALATITRSVNTAGALCEDPLMTILWIRTFSQGNKQNFIKNYNSLGQILQGRTFIWINLSFPYI